MWSAGFGDTISSTPTEQITSTGWLITYGIISMIGSIAAGILNQNDYTRFARKPRGTDLQLPSLRYHLLDHRDSG